MALTKTPVSISNTALLYIGADEITAFNDASREAKICNQIYETTKVSMLQKFPWRFSLRTRQLSKLATPPAEIQNFRFENAFLIPAESMRIIRTDQPSDDYIVVGENIFSNEDEIRVEMQIDPDESTLPDYFINALEFELAARLAMALTDDGGKYQIFQQKADLELARAKNIDSQEQPVLSPDGSVFATTSVRV
jgi:hypothetical protein